MLANVLLSVAATLLAILGAELILRVEMSEITTTYDNRSYFALKWKAKHVALNRFRYREREFDSQKPAGRYRIAMLGDSFMFAQGVEVEQRLSNLIEKQMNSSRHNVEVLNFGVSGANTVEELQRLRRDVLPLKPDFVLLQWFVNDVESSSGIPDPKAESFATKVKKFFLNHSVLYFAVVDVAHRALDMMGKSYQETIISRVTDPNSREAREAQSALQEFLRECKLHGVPVGVVLVPDLSRVKNHDYLFALLHRRVTETCVEEGVQCVDLLPVFLPYLEDQSKFMRLWVNRFDAHMGPLAQELAAARVLEQFGKLWMASVPTKNPLMSVTRSEKDSLILSGSSEVSYAGSVRDR